MAIWNQTRFEQRMELALATELVETEAEELKSAYVLARTKLLNDVLKEIRGEEPNLTDHGPDHIKNVLDNVEQLLPQDSNFFSAIELYLLGMCVLLHDVGNLEGRKKHNQRITKYFDMARPGEPEERAQEKRLIVSAAQAHTGKCKEGTADTLKDVPVQEHFGSHSVRLQEIAAVVRFADELAEGPQRTSYAMCALGLIPRESKIYHSYARVTRIAVDRGNGRIAATYHLAFRTDGKEGTSINDFPELLRYIYSRVLKLDTERQYARFYCSELLRPFRKVSFAANVQIDGEFYDDLLPTCELSDKILPNSAGQPFPERDPRFVVETVVALLRQKLDELDAGDVGGNSSATSEATVPATPGSGAQIK